MLNTLQSKFAAIYDGNGARSAELAGHVCKNRFNYAQAAYRHLQNPEIVAIIKSREILINNPLVADLEERLEFWTGVMRDNEEFVGMRLQASKLLGQACGDFIIKQEIDTKDSKAVLMVPFISPEEWKKEFIE